MTTVAICGLGGLGSNIAVMLTRAGIEKLLLIDHDKVEERNLSRQQYKKAQVGEYKTEALKNNLQEINPNVELKIENAFITNDNLEAFLKEADIVCEAFDNPEAKAMLVNGVLEKFPDKYLVAASGMADLGDPNAIKTKRISERFFLCGDLTSELGKNNMYSARVALCAAHQALTVLRIINKQI